MTVATVVFGFYTIVALLLGVGIGYQWCLELKHREEEDE